MNYSRLSILNVTQSGIEPETYSLEGCRSIQLSYWAIKIVVQKYKKSPNAVTSRGFLILIVANLQISHLHSADYKNPGLQTSRLLLHYYCTITTLYHKNIVLCTLLNHLLRP